MFDLTGRVAIVTGCGSARGIGRETALSLASMGAVVVAADIDAAGATETARLIEVTGKQAYSVRLDVCSEESVQAMVDEVLQKTGRIDILVNCAGISQRISVADMTLADMKRIFEVNVYGLFLCSKAVLPAMRKQQYGRIVNLASVSGKRGGGVFGGAHYAASKAAVLGFSKNLAREVVLDGITVNSVAPGLVNTDIFASMPEDALKKVIGDIPLGRLGNIKEVAATICFLASDEASYITGEEIDINGGSHMD